MTHKRIISILLVLAVIMSIAAVSFAVEDRAAAATVVSYSAQIVPPSVGSGKIASGLVVATGGFSPWFQSELSTVRTNYWLNATNSLGDAVNTAATNIVITGNTYKNYLTYKTGHGGSGNDYCLVASAAVASFEAYNVRGVWSPD